MHGEDRAGLVDGERNGPPGHPNDHQSVVYSRRLPRQPEAVANVEDGKHLALHVDEAEHLRRGLRDRSDGDHADDALDALERQGMALARQAERDESPG